MLYVVYLDRLDGPVLVASFLMKSDAERFLGSLPSFKRLYKIKETSDKAWDGWVKIKESM
jgi:hypothetical protein